MDIKSVKVDSDRGERGDWVGDIPGMGDLRLKVRSYANGDYSAFVAREIAAVPREQRVGGRAGAPLLPHIRDGIITRGTVEHVLLDWDNLTEDGQPVPFSKEQAMTYLADSDYRVLRNAIDYAAGEVEAIQAGEVDNATGNS